MMASAVMTTALVTSAAKEIEQATAGIVVEATVIQEIVHDRRAGSRIDVGR
ncbi:hypothetical protein [Bradyrhizobium prioriisuperbiae]|uniref:hypothetical protein n=1 Tax=Bradyrhizobium prioriisuperbiae TaxID=2854389 RepID=UPI0028E71A7B|nr:hypothetical protein [Bradyrhizobium prioritasuperba]